MSDNKHHTPARVCTPGAQRRADRYTCSGEPASANNNPGGTLQRSRTTSVTDICPVIILCASVCVHIIPKITVAKNEYVFARPFRDRRLAFEKSSTIFSRIFSNHLPILLSILLFVPFFIVVFCNMSFESRRNYYISHLLDEDYVQRMHRAHYTHTRTMKDSEIEMYFMHCISRCV